MNSNLDKILQMWQLDHLNSSDGSLNGRGVKERIHLMRSFRSCYTKIDNKKKLQSILLLVS